MSSPHSYQAQVFGPAWANRVVFPRITSLHQKETNYLLRLTILHAIAVRGARGLVACCALPNVRAETLLTSRRPSLSPPPAPAHDSTQVVAGALSSAPSFQQQLLPVLLSFSSDPVPNLRFNLAKALEQLVPHVADPAAVAGPIRGVLAVLLGDRDDDVRFYARRALTLCGS